MILRFKPADFSRNNPKVLSHKLQAETKHNRLAKGWVWLNQAANRLIDSELGDLLIGLHAAALDCLSFGLLVLGETDRDRDLAGDIDDIAFFF